MAAYGKNGKNKGKKRKIGLGKNGKVKGNKLAKRALRGVGRKLKSRVDNKVLGFQVDRSEHHDNELVTSPHERKRVDEKFVEARAEQRDQKRELAANPPAADAPLLDQRGTTTPQADGPGVLNATLIVADDGTIDAAARQKIDAALEKPFETSVIDSASDDPGYGIDPVTGRAYQSHAQKEACERIDEDLGDL